MTLITNGIRIGPHYGHVVHGTQSQEIEMKLAIFGSLVLSASIGLLPIQTRHQGELTATVFKTPSCGCCSKWIRLLEADSVRATIKDLADLKPTKDQYGVPENLRSCHTAIIGGYVFEGHVPIDLVRKVIADKPAIAGLAVPGMPIGSPGMELGSRRDAYSVIAFDKTGSQTTFAKR